MEMEMEADIDEEEETKVMEPQTQTLELEGLISADVEDSSDSAPISIGVAVAAMDPTSPNPALMTRSIGAYVDAMNEGQLCVQYSDDSECSNNDNHNASEVIVAALMPCEDKS